MFLLISFSVVAWIDSCYGVTFTAVGNLMQNDIFPCGEKITLMCSANKVSSMEFIYDGITVASCSGPTCGVDPNFAQNFTYDIASGTFNFTLESVQLSDDKRISTCIINGQSYDITSKVAELPENGSLSVSQKNTSTEVEVQAITGCVFPIENITFEWYTVTVTDAPVNKPYFANNNKTEHNNSLCKLSPKCQGSTGLSNSFVIPRLTRGENVFMEVHVIHQYLSGRQIAVKRSSEPIIIPDTTATTTGQTTATTTDAGEKNLKLGLGLGLGISGGLLAAISAVVFVCLIKDPVHELTVTSPKFTGTTMTIKLKFKSRLCRMKTFHVKLKDREIITKCKDGVIELTGLNPDSNYSASVFSTICIFQSCKKNIDFHTKGRPFPPYNFCEEQTSRTESSVTLKWNRAKGPMHTFVIKYKRTKGRMRDWMLTERINDTRYTLDGLKSGTCYTLLIHAENDVGYSEDSEPLLVKTSALIPVPPEEFRCESVKEDEVILSWKPFKKIRKQQFILTFYNMSEELPPGQDRKDTRIYIPYTGKPVMTYKVIELKPSSKYMFELHTSAGKRISERSAIACVETTDRDEDAYDVHGKRKSRETTSVFHITHT